MASSVKKLSRSVAGLGENLYRNRRSQPCQISPLFMVTGTRKRRRCTFDSPDDSIRPNHIVNDVDVTVARVLGANAINTTANHDSVGANEINTAATHNSTSVMSSPEAHPEANPVDNDATVTRLFGVTGGDTGTVTSSPDVSPVLNNDPVDNSNILLSYADLLRFQTDNFCCKNCGESLTYSSFEKIQVTFATSINYECICKRVCTLESRTKVEMGEDNRRKKKADRAIPHLVADYAINNQMILAMQQLGCGQAGAAVVGGMLSITPNAFHNTFTDIEVDIGKKQVAVGKKILEENVQKEIVLSEVNDDSQHLFCVSIDNAWNNRGSGRSYNSDSSHHITVGNRSGLVVALHYMSKRCSKCEIEKRKKKIRMMMMQRQARCTIQKSVR